MRVVIFIILAVLLGGGAAIAMFPMSVAADFAAKQAPDFRYTGASGRVWDGKLTGVSMGEQPIGDLLVKAEPLTLLGGKAAGKVTLSREGFTGETDVAWPLSGEALELSNLKLTGKAGLIPGVPHVVALGGGDFALEIAQLRFAGEVCESASGEVWTDALAKVDAKGWFGPELRGPVACRDGRLTLEANGRSKTGEDVKATLIISHRLDMELTAVVENAEGGAVEALTGLGFKPEGQGLVMRQALGS